ncbi:hypothetical protein, partial [Streptomyces djakartensis]|uniref:hypothetical protein n=1 Tax=Streptomyces djakartensis TaxID=68193 RepID=UPI001E37EABE
MYTSRYKLAKNFGSNTSQSRRPLTRAGHGSHYGAVTNLLLGRAPHIPSPSIHGSTKEAPMSNNAIPQTGQQRERNEQAEE